jgi:hypothetical protein
MPRWLTRLNDVVLVAMPILVIASLRDSKPGLAFLFASSLVGAIDSKLDLHNNPRLQGNTRFIATVRCALLVLSVGFLMTSWFFFPR